MAKHAQNQKREWKHTGYYDVEHSREGGGGSSRFSSLADAVMYMQQEQQKASYSRVALVPLMSRVKKPRWGATTHCKTCHSPYRVLTEDKLLSGHSVLCVSRHLERLNWPTMWMSLATHWHKHMAMFREPSWGMGPCRLHVGGVTPRIIFDQALAYPLWQFTPYPPVFQPEQQTVIFIRGLIGSGKSALAHTYAMTHRHLEADHYFMTHDGWFRYVSGAACEAHAWCQNMMRACLELHESVVIANTFCENNEMFPYAMIAQDHKAPVHIIDIVPWDSPRDHHLHHKISRNVLNRQYARWESCQLHEMPWGMPMSIQRQHIFTGRYPMPDLPYLCQPGVCNKQD